MNKFLILSFAIMGWGFYELSGGADFQPPQRPEPVQETARAAKPATVPVPAPSTPTLTRRNPAQPRPAPASVVAQAKPAQAAEAGEDRIEIRFGPSALPPADPNNPGLLVSLEQSTSQFATPLETFDPNAPTEAPEARTAAPAPIAEPEPDMREIRGTRVNMRDGPGTIYPVVGKLRLGQEIEVLTDSGTGWLRVRVMPGQQLGWVSASLTGQIN